MVLNQHPPPPHLKIHVKDEILDVIFQGETLNNKSKQCNQKIFQILMIINKIEHDNYILSVYFMHKISSTNHFISNLHIK